MNVHFIIILGIVTTASPTIIYNDAKQYNLFALYIDTLLSIGNR